MDALDKKLASVESITEGLGSIGYIASRRIATAIFVAETDPTIGQEEIHYFGSIRKVRTKIRGPHLEIDLELMQRKEALAAGGAK